MCSLFPFVSLIHPVGLSRDCYVRSGSNDCSVDPRFIGRMVNVHMNLIHVWMNLDGVEITRHERVCEQSFNHRATLLQIRIWCGILPVMTPRSAWILVPQLPSPAKGSHHEHRNGYAEGSCSPRAGTQSPTFIRSCRKVGADRSGIELVQ